MLRVIALILTALLLSSAPALAAPPPNDAPAGAVPLALGGASAASLTTGEATAGSEPGTAAAPQSCSRTGRTVWFKVRGTGHAITVGTAGSAIPTVVAVYDVPAGPSDGDRIACDDGVGGAGPAAATVASTVRGATYLVQVGGRIDPTCLVGADACAPSGDVVVTADGAPRPANDDRAGALALATGAPATVDTTGATLQAGEVSACGSAPFAGTVWFGWTAALPGTPSFAASAAFASGTVLTVYRAADGVALGCSSGGSVAPGSPVAAGTTLLVQAGALGADGAGLPEGPLTVSASFTPQDGDGDGEPVTTDCDDATPPSTTPPPTSRRTGSTRTAPAPTRPTRTRTAMGPTSRRTATTRIRPCTRARPTCPATSSTRTASAGLPTSCCRASTSPSRRCRAVAACASAACACRARRAGSAWR